MPSQRLASLDILRGFDLFLLVFLQPVLWAVLTQCGTPQAQAVLYHFDHEVWEGFRFWDLVMPLFLFMSGTSMPFAFARFLRGEAPKRQAVRKVLRRFVILFLLGMVVQGNLLSLQVDSLQFYTNTLQAIATGYLIASLLLLYLDWRGQCIAMVLLLAAYTIPMMLCGDYTVEGNLACRIDAAILGHYRGDPTYAWLLPSFNFGVTVLLGAFAGQIIRLDRQGATVRTALRLLAVGLALVLGGWLWSFDMPVIKRIWSSSMTLLSGGYCFLLMALFYYVVDVCRLHRPFDWLKVYGMNSIAAYMLGEVVNFRSVVDSLTYGLQQWLGDYYAAWLTFGNFLLLFGILVLMWRARLFVKI
ncbi:MAG: acyltransferase family protein [Alloprevotella sp.]